MGARAEWLRREAIVHSMFEPGELLMRPELHGIMKIRTDGGWVDGALAATRTEVVGGRMRGRLLWVATVGAGASLQGISEGLLSIPYHEITTYSMARGGWAPMVRELRLEVKGGERELRFRGGKTFVEDLVRLFGFVAPRQGG